MIRMDVTPNVTFGIFVLRGPSSERHPELGNVTCNVTPRHETHGENSPQRRQTHGDCPA